MAQSIQNFRYPDQPCAWNERDLILFAASIGCRAEELRYLYEKHPTFCAFPTYPVILQFKGAANSVVDYYSNILKPPPIPGKIERLIDPTRVLDGERHIEIFKTLPTSSEGRLFKLKTRVLGMYDKGASGTVVETEALLVEGSDIYCRIVRQSFAVGQGQWGGPRGPSRPSLMPPENRPADRVVTIDTRPELTLLYRLNGDYNPLHADPAVAQKAGFPQPILHGLCTWNITAHAVLDTFGTEEAMLREFQARFTNVVYPGETLTVEMWKMSHAGSGSTGSSENTLEIRFLTKIRDSGKVALSNGRAMIQVKHDKSRL
ncbi:uncharacterized protein Z519_04018 [Cladophialophora bantiana CBS 173.52]|uniref:MaoC-like domain-containing protein n=1 Tax=Cladophialophora bantiana (strain ATCC 10958 / CBS 173.52 / CDC B-1940 / NIH 8579) TaxID=1442370 RepID=A0A0D2IF81_CLAB1|nr:uncharacterized protein Z519_04018 [Cladophialophora bantiana CBS 173.52]KIW95434.1 hypothetical protein Z519_04018 [Cladophialophora bantiana CBS 173.52]